MVQVAITKCIERYNAALGEGEAPMTQARIASALGVTPGAVNRWSQGNRPVRVDVLTKIAKVLDCKPEDLLLEG